MGILDGSTGTMELANAGHNPPVRIDGGTAECQPVKAGFGRGGLETMRYTSGVLRLERGDCLYLYTDGVTEAVNTSNRDFGNERLLSAINRRIDGNAIVLKSVLE